MVCPWFSELCYCSCLPVLPCPAWVMLSYVMQTIFLYLVHNEYVRVTTHMALSRNCTLSLSIRPPRPHYTSHCLSLLPPPRMYLLTLQPERRYVADRVDYWVESTQVTSSQLVTQVKFSDSSWLKLFVMEVQNFRICLFGARSSEIWLRQ